MEREQSTSRMQVHFPLIMLGTFLQTKGIIPPDVDYSSFFEDNIIVIRRVLSNTPSPSVQAEPNTSLQDTLNSFLHIHTGFMYLDPENVPIIEMHCSSTPERLKNLENVVRYWPAEDFEAWVGSEFTAPPYALKDIEKMLEEDRKMIFGINGIPKSGYRGTIPLS